MHEIRVTDISSMTTILGGKGADIFTIYQTARRRDAARRPGRQRHVRLRQLRRRRVAPIHADVNDRGNPWDSGDQIVIDGSSSDDTIVSTDSQITGTGSQTVTYHRPDPDRNVLSLNINGNDGVDHITVQSTRDVVPVKVDGGAGNDIVNIGAGTLNDIVGLSRPGVQVPYGVGPVVVVGGAGLDTLIVDDSQRLDRSQRRARLVDRAAPDGSRRHRGRRRRRPRDDDVRGLQPLEPRR